MSTSEQPTFKVGQRVRLRPEDGASVGWLRYAGAISGAPAGAWAGVCWDKPDGKYDGEFKGKRYFTCEENHGAFLRPFKLSFPTSVLASLRQKYVKTEDAVALAASKAADVLVNGIQVEFRGIDKALSHVSGAELTEASFAKTSITCVGAAEEVVDEFPNVNNVDLSYSCFCGLQEFIKLNVAFPNVRCINLSGCPVFMNADGTYQQNSDPKSLNTAFNGTFPNLRELILRDSSVSLSQGLALSIAIPSLRRLHLGDTRVWDFHPELVAELAGKCSLNFLALDNTNTTWENLHQISGMKLQVLILSGCSSLTDPVTPLPTPWLPQLQILSICETGVSKWSTLETLFPLPSTPTPTPHLHELRAHTMPLLSGLNGAVAHRVLLARLAPALKRLNQSDESEKQYSDALGLYIRGVLADATRLSAPERVAWIARAHPRLWWLAKFTDVPVPQELQQQQQGQGQSAAGAGAAGAGAEEEAGVVVEVEVLYKGELVRKVRVPPELTLRELAAVVAEPAGGRFAATGLGADVGDKVLRGAHLGRAVGEFKQVNFIE